MKVLHVAHSVYPLAQAGTEIYTAELARALSQSGVELKVAIPSYAVGKASPSVVERLDPCVEVIAMSPGGWWGNKFRALKFQGPLWQAELRRLVRSFRPDIVHIQHAVGFGLPVFRLFGDEGLPMVVTLPDYWLLCEGLLRRCQGKRWRCATQCRPRINRTRLSRFGAYCRVCLRERQIRQAVHRYRPTLAAISESTRQTFLRAGFPAELLVTRPWGIDESLFRSGSEPASGGSNAPIRIAYLGSVRPHKGCHILLEAFNRLGNVAELHFHGAGDPTYTASLQEQSNKPGVYFHGRFDHAEVPHILSRVDVVVIPSIWDETYCLVFQEAMAARKPVIASAVGGLSDRVIDGVNGFLVPPGDAAALAAKLDWLLHHLPEVRSILDYDRCHLDIEQDCREWIELYEITISRMRMRQRTVKLSAQTAQSFYASH